MEPFSQIQQLNIEKEVVGLFISGHPLDQYKLEIDSFTNATLTALNDLDALKGKNELRLAGSVASFAHRTTKNGKPFGTLTMEDYHGTFTFFLFGEDYVKFKQYFMTGWFLFINGGVAQKKWGNENELEFKINSISLLSEVRGRMIKGLKVNINLDDLTLDLMEKLESITTKYKGDAKLYIEVLDRQENISLELFSKKMKVDPSAELIKELKLLPEVAYKIMDR
jgi:DNA polymerase-3 subunit alpha